VEEFFARVISKCNPYDLRGKNSRLKKILAVAQILVLILISILFLSSSSVVYGMAADCLLQPTGENYIGVRYKALLAEDELSETGWVLLFGGNGFTNNGEYQPHFMDLMIKGWWADIYDDPLCASGFPPRKILKNFSIEFGLSDYEDTTIQDNDIAAWSEDPQIFPRMFTNIDSSDPQAPDKIMAVYQVDKGGTLEGREIEVSLVRGEVTRLPKDQNYFMDPDSGCTPNSQVDILYRQWVATLKVPSLGINSSVYFYVNANQGDKIIGTNTLNFMWENYHRPVIESDRFKVIIFDLEVKKASGEWKKAERFLVDLRSPREELPLNDKGELVGGFRKVSYKGRPAIEASFGYGYTDYVIDGDPTKYEPSDATKAVIDLRYEGNDPPIELTIALNKISEGGDHQWDQEAVDSANRILSNTSYSSADWERFFFRYFEQNPFFTDGLRSYLGYPVFAWFSEESHRNLQGGLVNPLIQLVEQLMLQYHQNLSQVIDANPKLLQTLMNSHRFLASLAWGGGWSQGSLLTEAKRVDVYNYYKAHINNYKDLWKSNVTFDPVRQPYLSTVRAQIWMALRDALPLTNNLKIEIAEVIGLAGRYREIWNNFSVLIIDNNGLDDVQLRVIYNFLNHIPRELHNLGSITVKDFMEVPDKRHLWFVTKSSVNIFGFRVGEYAGNDFPDDVAPKYSDSFSIVLAHEVNHVADAYFVSKNDNYQKRKETLLTRAGNESMNYLRSMFGNDFFTTFPQEFFASISNQWFSDSFHTLELGLTRFSKGYKEPINQFLFFADIYSLGFNQTIFYTLDTKGNITKKQIPLTRDSNNYINSLDYNGIKYVFNLDYEGNVLSINVVPISPQPVALFEYYPEKPAVNATVTFDASESYSPKGNITSYEWNFDDGNTTTITEPMTSHTYALPGKYTATLKVTDNNTQWNTTSRIITVYYVTDLNKDGIINIIDIAIVAKAFGSKPGDPNWNATADLDKNGWINIIDIATVARDFGKESAPLAGVSRICILWY
jgi:PKD repeat protein